MKLNLRRIEERIRFHSPLQGMQEVEDIIERRQDPLLGHWSITTRRLHDKVRIFFGETDDELISKEAERTRGRCFFCPEKVEQATPMYPSRWLPEGRLRVGEALLVPNLYPLSPIHSVIILGRRHFLN